MEISQQGTRIRRTLRIHWSVMTLLLMASMVAELIDFPWSSHVHPNHYYFYTEKILVFIIFIVATYRNSRSLWFFVLVVNSLKAVSLLRFYFTTDYEIPSTYYYREYTIILFRLKLPFVADLLFGNHLGNALLMLSLYGYWLYQCEKLLQTAGPNTR
ncbi:hypothetical protein GKZ68_02590 [Hymenobacter sp. BRD128]|uniref:hypothetical protein n=1 Tax=Hymenobacter sp. BRD128 TaxID=2675878 RepID=UPI0015678C61|nr:hypothetical protein [Hymenobacter sp. BRD128]QKG55621.1 hypothetical protein GKZ68_02590 [Hymenobacter sp. BRD128]